MDRHSPKLTLLTEPVVKEIIDEAMGLLENTGVTVEEPDTLELLAEMGANIDSGKHVAKFKRDMVERAVASAPKQLGFTASRVRSVSLSVTGRFTSTRAPPRFSFWTWTAP